MKHERAIAAIIAALILSALAAGCSDSSQPRIGLALYSFDDAFTSGARRSFEAEAAGKARLQVVNGQNRERIQADQVEAMIENGADVVIVNPVDRSSSASTSAQRAKDAGIPMVFFGREPPAMTIKSWDRIYYLGVHSDEATGSQAEILRDYCELNPDADTDGDGVIRYALLRGEAGYINVSVRDSFRNEVLDSSALDFEMLAEATANWSRAEAQRKMTEIITRYKSQIEAVLCDNDEMALGAVAALRIAGYLRSSSSYVPVLGIDATPVGIEAVKEGLLLGTLRSDAEVQGQELFQLAYDIAKRKDLSRRNLQEGQYYYFSFEKVTRANAASFAR